MDIHYYNFYNGTDAPTSMSDNRYKSKQITRLNYDWFACKNIKYRNLETARNQRIISLSVSSV